MTLSIRELLDRAVREEVSDLHLNVMCQPTFRIAGDLKRTEDGSLTAEDTERLAGEIVPERLASQFAVTHTADFSHRHSDRIFRVQISKNHQGYALALRLFPKRIWTPTELGLSEEIVERIFAPSGLFLFTGPTGSGKTTTAASLLNSAVHNTDDSAGRVIITVEEPVEYLLPHGPGSSVVEQFEVPTDKPSFPAALKDALRRDLDVLFVGELREAEAVEMSVQAGISGHLVLATVHAANASDCIHRLLGLFEPDRRRQIKDALIQSLHGILSQRLLKTPDGRSRVLCYELLWATDAVRNKIRIDQAGGLSDEIQTGVKQGMVTFDRCLVDLVQNDRITLEEARRQASNPEFVEKSLQ